MQNIQNILGYLIGADFRQWLMEEANDLHHRARAIVYWLIILAVLGISFNLFGWFKLNLYVGIVMVIIAFLFITRPAVLLTIFGIGAVTNQSSFRPTEILGNAITGGKELLENAARRVSIFFIYFSFFFLATGTLNFRNNPGAIPMVILCLAIFFWMGQAGWFKVTFQKTFIYTYTTVALVLSICSFIPRSGYIKMIGFYPFHILQTNDMEDGVSNVEEAMRRKALENDADRLRSIERKIDNNERLTSEEQAFLIQKQRERNNSKITKQLAGFFTRTAEASAMEIRSRVLTQGKYGYIVESGSSSIWFESATAYDITSPNMEFDIVTVDGRIIPSFQKDKWPINEPFQIMAITTRQNLEITVL